MTESLSLLRRIILDNLINNWLMHVDGFPRSMSAGAGVSQFKVYGEKQYMDNLLRNIGQDCYVSVHSEEQVANNRYNKIYLDFDSDDINKAFLDTIKVYRYFVNKGIYPRVYFSGSKGYNMYFDFPETVFPPLEGVEDSYGLRVHSFGLALKDTLKVSTLDVGASVDKKRISRVPFTTNTKSGYMCIPVEIDVVERVAEGIEINVIKQPSEDFIKHFLSLPLHPELKVNVVDYERPQSNSTVGEMLSYVLANTDSGNVPQGSRTNLVWKVILPAMVHLQWTDEQIITETQQYYERVFGYWKYENKTWVQQQVRLLRQKGIYPMRLDNFRNTYGLGNL